ncbi:DUF2500 family protein [Blastopirellula sp. JC732]|uniref:DUF2500 family protein n=1 Tax=Blastopirellula sediminis TaxID=2894196 RepID=A0A9X1MRZ0_9BACT|nr:DUF2500 family protein [Blastopirellula sediminis]MCC9605748.1 DUF2500 family protein [Blastopirellula sediminis]MCC9630952.1 DUF2500 family protein [Blastopirellula sediminis]
MKCTSCGADSPAEARFCHYCGGQFELPMPQRQSRAEIFARIKASPQFLEGQTPERIAKVPKPSTASKTLFNVFSYLLVGKIAMAIVVPIGFVLLFGFIMFAGSSLSPSSALPIGLLLVGGLILFMLFVSMTLGIVVRSFGNHVFSAIFKKQEELEKAPVEVQPAIAIAKRTHVWGESARTQYFVTFELEDGQRKEYALWYDTMYGRIAEQDAGVLFSRADYAADFDLVTV